MFSEGLQVYKTYHQFGLQLDGTFRREKYAGTGIVLIACIKDAHNKIFIVAIAVVAGENADNWEWFLQNIKANCDV